MFPLQPKSFLLFPQNYVLSHVIMYSREELKLLKKEFWEGFGDYSSSLPALQSKRRNFLLHNTRFKGVSLKFDATRDGAYVILEISHRDTARQQRIYDHFLRYKVILEDNFPEGLIWEEMYVLETGQMVSRIYTKHPNLDIHRRSHWPDFYRFMADAMIRLERNFLDVKSAWSE